MNTKKQNFIRRNKKDKQQQHVACMFYSGVFDTSIIITLPVLDLLLIQEGLKQPKFEGG